MPEKAPSFLGDVGTVWKRRREIWRLVSRADKVGFISGVLIMAVVAAVETGIALLIGWFFTRVTAFARSARSRVAAHRNYVARHSGWRLHFQRNVELVATLDRHADHYAHRAQHDRPSGWSSSES